MIAGNIRAPKPTTGITTMVNLAIIFEQSCCFSRLIIS